jgi:Uma2 family endonuclease
MAIQRPTEASFNPADATTPREPRPRLFTVDEYCKMAEVGILRPDERVQLIEGKIVAMPSISPRHAYNVTRLARLFTDRLGDTVDVRAQNPIRLASGAQPEPDIAIVMRHPADPKVYESRHPGSDDTLLVLEVADSTLSFDLGEKAEMYADHGVVDYWVLDLMGHRVVVHRDPTPEGHESVISFESGGTITLFAVSDATFAIDEILG